MSKHNYYRLEVFPENANYPIGCCSVSPQVCMMMVELGLEAPELSFAQKYEFWFTRKGAKEIGIHCFKILKEEFPRRSIFLRKMVDVARHTIAYQDELQIAIKL